MTERDVHLPVAARPSADDFVDLTVRAESLGYDRAWLSETWGRDAVSVLSVLAERTTDIGLGSGILNVYSRSPALLGQTAATLQEVSDGRFRLGIGPSGPAVVEGWHGAEFDRPLRRTREALEIIDLVTTGRTVTYEGECFDLAGGFRLRSDPPATRPPVDVAAMGPTAVEMAGRYADGWDAYLFSPDGMRDRLGDLRRGLEKGDRDEGDVRVVLGVVCSALEDGERARDLARRHVAFYVGAMGTYYRDSVARQGFEDRAHEIAAAWANGEREAAAATVDDEMLDAFAAAGTPANARERLDEFAAVEGVDAVAVAFPRSAESEEIDATLEALGPET